MIQNNKSALLFKTLKGFGTLEYRNGDVYYGNFIDDHFEGFGEMKFSCGDNYKGEWRSSQMCGQGVYKFISGEVYEGQFIQDKFNGYGKLIYKDGSCYEGEFRDDYAWGAGVYRSGEIENRGHFDRGKFIGDFINMRVIESNISLASPRKISENIEDVEVKNVQEIPPMHQAGIPCMESSSVGDVAPTEVMPPPVQSQELIDNLDLSNFMKSTPEIFRQSFVDAFAVPQSQTYQLDLKLPLNPLLIPSTGEETDMTKRQKIF